MRRLWLTLMLVLVLATAGTSATTYWAKPDGSTTADCLSQANACTVARVLALPDFNAGDTLTLMEGTYSATGTAGTANLLRPGVVAPGKSGTSGARITVECVNDGQCTFDAEYTAVNAVRLTNNDFWTLRGFNAHSTDNAGVFLLDGGSSNTLTERVIVWDSSTSGGGFAVSGVGSDDNTFRDCAAFGQARKIFSPTQGPKRTWVDRCVGLFGGSRTIGPKQGVTLLYNTFDTLVTNSVFLWPGETQPENYQLFNQNGTQSTGVPGCSTGDCTNYWLDQPYGAISVDRLDTSGAHCSGVESRCTGHDAGLKAYGNLIIYRSTDRNPNNSNHPFIGLLSAFGDGTGTTTNTAVFQDIYVYSEQDVRSVNMRGNAGSPVAGLVLNRITSVRGGATTDILGTRWTQSNISQGTSAAAVASPWGNNGGANLCMRKNADGTDSTTKMWPLPIVTPNGGRLKAALTAAGAHTGPCTDCSGGRSARVAIDVMAVIEAELGTIPAACIDSQPASEFESAPDFPSTSQIDAFTGTGAMPAGFTTVSGAGMSLVSDAAKSTSGFSVVLHDTLRAANQENWGPIATLPNEGGSGCGWQFWGVDGNNRWLVEANRVTGAANDQLTIKERTSGGGLVTRQVVELSFDWAVGYQAGVRTDGTTVKAYVWRPDWTTGTTSEWRRVTSYTATVSPVASKIGLGGDTCAFGSFNGGSIGSDPGSVPAPRAAPQIKTGPQIKAVPQVR